MNSNNTRTDLVYAPLGGVGEIGMNLSIYGLGSDHKRSWLAVDLGVSFAQEEHLPGVDLILPDIGFLVSERKNLAGIVITHAHEDHFGALMDLWPKLKVPLFATPFTAALLEAKLGSERGVAPEIPVNIVDLGLVYECTLGHRNDGTRKVDVRMTLTAPGCGMGDILVDDVRNKLEAIPTIAEADVELTFEPPWNHTMMSDVAKLETGML